MIIGTPVFFFDMTAQAKIIIDRCIAMQPFGKPLANKMGGVVVAAGSTGTEAVIKNLYVFFGFHRMFPVNWVAAYSPVQEKEKGMHAAFDLGREMVEMIRKKPEYSPDFSPQHITYGTHTF